MKIAFFSNYLTHHQLPFCEELIKNNEIDFTFIACEKITEERIAFGYEDMNSKYDFVLCSQLSEENQKKALQIADEADVVILGSAPIHYVENRLKNKKLTFRYTERLFKKECHGIEFLKIFLIQQRLHAFKPSLYLLAASAYAPADYQKLGLFKQKAYRWGYFPQLKTYPDIKHIIKNKKENSILWCGRFLELKHPEMAIEIAQKLKENNLSFHLSIIGSGPLEQKLKEMIQERGLHEYIEMLGSMSPEKVREYMERSQIFLFTSDRNEGWGAVLNEAMNSACTVIASQDIGAVPFLLKNNENGMIYNNGSIDELYKDIQMLLNDKKLCEKLGENAYKTLSEEWNAAVATERFIILCNELLKNNKPVVCFDSGPCSPAPIITN